MNKRRFAISDIHGCLNTFQELLAALAFSQNDTLFLLGDYIDRGPDSVGVVRYIQELIKEKYDVVCLMGNHEKLLLEEFAKDTNEWERLGGRGFRRREKPNGLWRNWEKEDLDFMAQLKTHHVLEDYILVHAGLNFGFADPFIDTHSLLWIRNWYETINYDWLNGRIIVHGHTWLEKQEIEFLLKNVDRNRVLNIDSGCSFKTTYKRFLCAYNLDAMTMTFQPNIENLRPNP